MQMLSLAVLALAGGQAPAESQYGSGTGTITAQAKVNLSVTVPKLILLRVGSTNTTIDTVTWASTLSIPPVPTTPVTGNNTNVDWNGAAPTVTPASTTNTLNVYAWTNAGAGTINCAMGTWAPAAGGPRTRTSPSRPRARCRTPGPTSAPAPRPRSPRTRSPRAPGPTRSAAHPRAGWRAPTRTPSRTRPRAS